MFLPASAKIKQALAHSSAQTIAGYCAGKFAAYLPPMAGALSLATAWFRQTVTLPLQPGSDPLRSGSGLFFARLPAPALVRVERAKTHPKFAALKLPIRDEGGRICSKRS